MQELIHAAKVKDLMIFLAAMASVCIETSAYCDSFVTCIQVTISKMQTLMHHGELSVSQSSYSVYCLSSPSFICVFSVIIDVKMDWCNTKINGTQLDPKVQYPEMVRVMH